MGPFKVLCWSIMKWKYQNLLCHTYQELYRKFRNSYSEYSWADFGGKNCWFKSWKQQSRVLSIEDNYYQVSSDSAESSWPITAVVSCVIGNNFVALSCFFFCCQLSLYSLNMVLALVLDNFCPKKCQEPGSWHSSWQIYCQEPVLDTFTVKNQFLTVSRTSSWHSP